MKSRLACDPHAGMGEQEAWIRLSARQYDQAVYTSPLLRPLLDYELDTIRTVLEPADVLLEVGCGTGQFCRRLITAARAVVGIDISSAMLDELRKHTGHRMLLIQGDAIRLSALLKANPTFQALTADTPRVVVSCVMNTLGIMPEKTRRAVMRQMARVAGPTGKVFVVAFNAAHFDRGIEEFYRVNSGLCGAIDEGCIDRRSSELTVPGSGYFTHWFTEEELWEIANDAQLSNVQITARGIAFLLLADGPSCIGSRRRGHEHQAR